MTAWNFLQVEVVPADRMIRPMIGPGELTREQAHAEIQRLLDRAPQLADVAARWRAGAKDDTVYAGPFVWAIYEHDEGRVREAAMVWLDDLATTMRGAGVDVQIARPPD